jgi:hypothetical protein
MPVVKEERRNGFNELLSCELLSDDLLFDGRLSKGLSSDRLPFEELLLQ